MAASRILVVDDEESISKLVEYNLQQAGFEVQTADTGTRAYEILQETPRPDLVVLDLMLPGIGGMELCQRLRKEGISTPIIMLTAKEDEVDRILGLEMGADDYVTKPFSPRELVARVKAVLRRANEDSTEEEGVYNCGDIILDVNRYEVSIRGDRVDLTPREFELLHFLAKHTGRVMSRDHLLDKVWGYEFAGDTRIVDVHISHLRDKLERDPKQPEYIKTVRGVGYKLVRSE
ncbi:response regulator transcription factor [Tumebacillus sp. ITR2]|uniref:Response regulator transcription factor n=1 Tax=Tumebacillus amylolyticus TaxID=2801339 RepID=A0ABS1J624_9BACL|nr:response regulator transcription factor [Tumebacillus amylolyticus]MBL0385504.1 response regulator transcription factor [Tumebacillus amylolyticus]